MQRRNPAERIYINRNLPVARAGAVTGDYGYLELREPANGAEVRDLAGSRLVLDRRLIAVHNSQAQIDIGDLGVHRSEENSVPTPDHCLVILKGVPREGNSRSKILGVRRQRKKLRVQFIAQTIVEGELGGHFPRVLRVKRRERPGVIRVCRISETLLGNLRQTKRRRLQGVDGGSGKLWTDQKAGKRPEHKAAREKSVRFGVIAAEYLVAAELKGVTAADDREIVRKFVTAQDGKVGYENIRSQVVDEAWNLQPHFSRLIRNYVKAFVIPLHTGFVLCDCTELAVPGGLQIAIVGVGRTPGRESG